MNNAFDNDFIKKHREHVDYIESTGLYPDKVQDDENFQDAVDAMVRIGNLRVTDLITEKKN